MAFQDQMSTQDPGARRAALSDAKRALLEARLRGAPPAAAAPSATVTRCAGEGPEFPASFAQERMWFLSRFAPESPMYNVPAGMLVSAEVDVPALERALTETVRRHEVLRTTFRMGSGGQLLQVVQPAARVPVEVTDVRDRVGEPFAEHVNALVAEEAARVFDLERGPMIRVALLRVSGAEYAMVITVHHIAADGWSLPPLLRDLLAAYEAYHAGVEPRQPEPGLRYADYAVWQRNHLRGETLEAQVRYWRELLHDAPALDLPTDHPRPPVSSNAGRTLPLRLDPEPARRVREVGRQQSATANMVLLAAFAETMRRWSGQDDLVVGTVLGSRPRPELEPIVGMFVNSAALRLRFAPGATFRDAVALARHAVLEASRHQDLPFEKLVDELGVPRDPSRHPLFQVLYFHASQTPTHQGADAGAPPVLPMRPIDPDGRADMVDTGTAKFDLQLTTYETEDGIGGRIEYATDLFDAPTVAAIGRTFRAVLAAATRRPDAPLAALDLLTPDERRRLLEGWGAGPSVPVPAEPLHARVVAQCRRTPHAPAVAWAGGTMTYAELDARSARLARHLRARGVGPDARVGVCLERGPEMMVAVLGVLRAGGACVPVDPAYPAERIAHLLADSAAPVLLTQARLEAALPATGAVVVRVDADAEAIAAESAEPLEDGAGPDHLAYVIYTSGSTGRPKGVAMPHRPLVNLLEWQQREWKHPAASATLQFTTLSFDVAFQEIFSCWRAGGRLVLVSEDERRDLAAVLRRLDAERVERLFLPYVALQHLAELAAERGRAPRALREVQTAGEQLRVTEPIRRFFQATGALLSNQYGPSETHVATAGRLRGAPEAWPLLPAIGGPIANTRCYVLDAALHPAPAGIPGELYLGGACLARGYLARPGLTAERFLPDPFAGAPGARMYRTGDRVRWKESASVRECVSASVEDSQGAGSDPRSQPPFTHALTHPRTHALEFLGRADDQVKVRGFRIEPGEVEAALESHSAVREAVVVVREDAPGDRRLVGYVVPAAGAEVPPAELRTHLQGRLPEYMVPSAFVVLDAFPLTPSGKVARRALPAPDRAGEGAGEVVPPRNAVEDMVAEVWAEVLRREGLGVTQNFFELGGHSLMATQVLVRINEAFEVEIPLRDFFQDPTIAGLAAVVEAAGSPVLAAMVDELAGLSAAEIEALLAEEGV
jgi:amino acid adenylation domain-containing protein